MDILVVGSGGREHALVWKIHQNAGRIFCAPGNAGIEELAECVPIRATEIETLVRFALEHSIDLTVVGPEQPLTEGIVDRFEREGLKIFGPSRAAARLEGSKVFAKEFMNRHDIPTSQFGTFDKSRRGEALRFMDRLTPPIVVKVDGLAAGKGVIICPTRQEAMHAIEMMMDQRAFGPAGDRIVIEEYLEGEEMSVFALTDGKSFRVLPTAQDHKRILDGDKGKNTGGMGAYAPAPEGTPGLMEEIGTRIIRPTIEGMANEGTPYKGCLYVGLMLTAEGPKVLEYNCRLGDPEAQAVLQLIQNDAVELFLACASGDLQAIEVKQKPCSAVCVVMASSGYPDSYETDKPISGLDADFGDVIVFHAGTKRRGAEILTAGGRVLGITALGPQSSLQEAIDKAYGAARNIHFEGAYFRSDIGRKGVRAQARALEIH